MGLGSVASYCWSGFILEHFSVVTPFIISSCLAFYFICINMEIFTRTKKTSSKFTKITVFNMILAIKLFY